MVLGAARQRLLGRLPGTVERRRQILAWLEERDGVPWRVVNLSKSGARTGDVVADQLPALAAMNPDLVSCA